MKTNKKGFTLAELLIVISIIAILISIAIPAFSGALDSAKVQADHANMRSAYSIAQVANLQGYMEVADGTHKVSDGVKEFAFQLDGSVGAITGTGANPYILKAAHAKDFPECSSSAVCMSNEKNAVTSGSYIKIKFDGTNYKVVLE